jgi:hypothetical protein
MTKCVFGYNEFSQKHFCIIRLPAIWHGFPVTGHGDTPTQARQNCVNEVLHLRRRLKTIRSGQAIQRRPMGMPAERTLWSIGWTTGSVETNFCV